VFGGRKRRRVPSRRDEAEKLLPLLMFSDCCDFILYTDLTLKFTSVHLL